MPIVSGVVLRQKLEEPRYLPDPPISCAAQKQLSSESKEDMDASERMLT